jgi:hypothetical protein
VISPRKNETDAVVAILEDPGYDGPGPMAKAIVKALATEFQQRPWYAVAHRFGKGDQGINLGPFPGRPDAERYRKAIATGETVVVPLHPPVLAEADEAGVCRCGHAKELHQLGYCAVLNRRDRSACGCSGWEKK